MNNTRRKALKQVEINLKAKLDQLFEEAKGELETLRDEEDEALENLPESLQLADRGCAMTDAINEVDYAIDSLDAEEVLSGFSSYIEDATI